MPELKILPSNVANMIAAGEVVQRPSSVVKELMENAVDAGALSVNVIITDAGRTLIRVIDNGCGMSPEEALLCFERHATSKIATAEDLTSISSFGFRGEALASIAAVAEVTLRTCREGDDLGTEVVFADSKLVSRIESAAPVGSSFSVRNLFYNIPARRKFLKSDNVEFRHIVEEFVRVALTRPDIAFSLVHNGRDIHILKPAKSLKFRVLDLLGNNVAKDVVDINQQTTLFKLTGYLGRPDSARKMLGNQFFFVNGRYFRSSYLHKAVMKAYEEFVPEGLTPPYFLYFETDPRSVDVNISPNKSEVKFEDESLVFQMLYACVRETLGRNSFGACIDFDTEGMVDLPVLGKSFDEYRTTAAPTVGIDPNYNPFDSPFENPFGSAQSEKDWQSPAPQSPAPQDSSRSGSFPPSYGPGAAVERRDDYGKLFETKIMPSTQTIFVQDRYIATNAKSGLMLVHVRRAFERILYERFLGAIADGEHVSQVSLFPEQIQVGVENRLLLDEHAETLAGLGFDIAPLGNDTIVVNAVPDGFSCESGKVQKMVADIIFILEEGKHSLAATMQSSMAERFAAMGATSAKMPSSSFEAQRLIDSLFATGNAEFTPRGKRIVTIVTVDDIDKKFQ